MKAFLAALLALRKMRSSFFAAFCATFAAFFAARR
jgi:hypothetical protein